MSNFASLRDKEVVLTETQNAEEAHVRVRFDLFMFGPESVARRRRAALQDLERRFNMYRSSGDLPAVRFSRRDRNELALLRWLYPEPSRRSEEFEIMGYHPFKDELPRADGNFYSPHTYFWPEDASIEPEAVSSGNAPASDPLPSVDPAILR